MCLGAIYWAGVRRVFFSATRHDAAAGGFSDEELYVELPKPLEERRIPMVRLLPEAGGGPFAAWAAKADKVPY
jgi:tRNA(Arg) A34 adenosine deaminase TadA